MANEITSEVRNNAMIITFNRPDRGNSLSNDMAAQLFQVIKPVATDRGIHAVLLRGAGGNFMDGLDMMTFAGDFNTAVERASNMTQPYASIIRELHIMEKPVLAAVEGNVAGPGLSLMLACDLVIAARNTKFNCKFTTYAMTPDGAASFFLARKVGMAKANELLMLSETFTAEDADRMNLVSSVVDDDKLQEESLRWIDRLATGPTRAYGGIKRLVGQAFENNLNSHLSLEHSFWGASTRTFDFREAVRAHFAKREAKFTGI